MENHLLKWVISQVPEAAEFLIEQTNKLKGVNDGSKVEKAGIERRDMRRMQTQEKVQNSGKGNYEKV